MNGSCPSRSRIRKIVKVLVGFPPCESADISDDLFYNSSKCCIDARRAVYCLPLFAIVGAMKCATGILRKWLNFHPQLISGSGLKFTGSSGKAISTREVHFFSSENRNFDCQKNCFTQTHLSYITHYRKHFKTPEILNTKYSSNILSSLESKSWKFTFDKSPDYMRSTCALEALKCTTPDIKIIVILRDPIERSFSEFHHHCRHRRFHLHESGRIHFAHSPSSSSSNMYNSSLDEYLKVLYPCTAENFHDYLFHPCRPQNSCALQSVLSKHAPHFGDRRHDLPRHTAGTADASGFLSLYVKNFSRESVSIPLQREIAHGFYDEQLLSILRM